MGNFVFGVVLIIFSVPVLWFNESRTAQMESLIALAKDSVRTVEEKQAEEENSNWLVHVQGAPLHGAAKVADKQFDVAFESGCIKLMSSVEVYQVIEHQQKKEKEKLGGGKQVTTTYTYTEEWSGMWHDSSSYHDDKQRRRNNKPQGLDVTTFTQVCGRVEYGSGFLLSDALTQQCHDFRSATEKLGEKVRLKTAGVDFKKDGDYYYHSSGRQGTTQVGDARVRFEYVPDGPATVMALQTSSKPGGARASFMPYRLIRRPYCGSLSEEAEKKALKVQGQKSASQLADEAMCTGWLACLCCACNLVMCCCSSLLTPEINHLWSGSRDQYECLKMIQTENTVMKWGIRFLGWTMMFAGSYMLFSPLLTLITVIPLLGPMLSTLGGWLIWFLCLFVTAVWAIAIIMVAYLFYHPIVALLYGLGITAIVVGTTFVLGLLSN